MTDGGCGETSGFLFKHACRNDPANNCGKCEKVICVEHSHIENDEAMCTTCARKQVGKSGFDSGKGRRRHRSTYYDDPYFYDMRYYSGYGHYDSSWGVRSHHRHHHHHDRDDFTEADGQSFNDPGDADFEDDMSAS